MPCWRTTVGTVVRVLTKRYMRDYEYFADTHTHTHNFTHSEQTEFVIYPNVKPLLT